MGKRKPNALDNFIDRINEYEREEQRAGCKMLIYFMVGIGVLGIVMIIVGAILAFVEESNVVSIYGEQLANSCNPMPVGADSLDNMPDAASPFGLLILIEGTRQRHAWFQDVPAMWRAETQDAVDLIACVEEEKVTLETCEYERASTRGNGSFTIKIERIQYSTTVVAVNPVTGRRIASLTLDGTEPDACPPDTSDITTSQTIYGDKATFSDIGTWIEPLIFDE